MKDFPFSPIPFIPPYCNGRFVLSFFQRLISPCLFCSLKDHCFFAYIIFLLNHQPFLLQQILLYFHIYIYMISLFTYFPPTLLLLMSLISLYPIFKVISVLLAAVFYISHGQFTIFIAFNSSTLDTTDILLLKYFPCFAHTILQSSGFLFITSPSKYIYILVIFLCLISKFEYSVIRIVPHSPPPSVPAFSVISFTYTD